MLIGKYVSHLLLGSLMLALGAGLNSFGDGLKGFKPEGFVFEKELDVALSPEEAFDAFTGDVTSWWDHHMSETPLRMEIEARPGGKFIEIFDEAGNGVVHADVTHADRGKKLVMRGPLGLHGTAIDLVQNFDFEKVEGGTRIKASFHLAGEIDEQVAAIVSSVWDHFLLEQYAEHVKSM